jgi:hypothetical protein
VDFGGYGRDGPTTRAVAARRQICNVRSACSLIFMKFLYRRLPFRLENICGNRQVIAAGAGGRFRILDPHQGTDRATAFPVRPNALVRTLQMLDLAMLAIALAFFALSVGYTIACDRL